MVAADGGRPLGVGCGLALLTKSLLLPFLPILALALVWGRPSGRALLDLGLMLDYELSDNWRIGGGYRTLEGGADTDDVYSFGWLHYATVDVRYRF